MLREVDLGHLRRAIELARLARQKGNHPFGALLVGPAGDVLAEAENTVVTERDCTGHAELNLVRMASRGHAAEILAGCTLFTSTEPCAMCAGAIHWSGVGRVVYALSEDRLYQLTTPDQAEESLRVPCREIFAHAGRPIEVIGPAMEAEAAEVHAGFWGQGGDPPRGTSDGSHA
jgi:tRNA(Arg) A34 adenosine deaminase TadA